MKKYDKPFKSLDDQLSLLHDKRHLDLEGNEEEIKKYLLSVGYYNIINGYGEQFEINQKESKIYKDNSTFSDIFKQYVADQAIARAVVPDLLKIEQKLDSLLGYFVAKAFGVNHFAYGDLNNPWPDDKSYLDRNNYNLSNGPYSSVEKMYEVIEEAHGNPLAYYRDHANHIPPWILFSATEFGTVNRYYTALPYEMKLNVANYMFPKKYNNLKADNILMRSMFNYLEIVRLFRNQFAHNSRFSFSKFVDFALGKKFRDYFKADFLFSAQEYKSGNGKGDLYNLFIILVLFADNYSKAAVQIEYYTNTISSQFVYFDEFGSQHTDEKGLSAFITSSNLPENFNKRLLRFAKIIHE
ncbi:Abi family protein [Leuconostoc gasicomitatum]|uniref:Abi family protein n=1 Tax=Leuconostoc gasicomitatum TaxID=115778 RepID=UPI001CC75A1F|nr:Abi family protein [Leuconostoc gasicomitatum]MBZ5969509.1 Abi family protein [Leuconostoc gasicomitatum]